MGVGKWAVSADYPDELRKEVWGIIAPKGKMVNVELVECNKRHWGAAALEHLTV